MEVVAGLSLKNLRPRVWDRRSPEFVPKLQAVMLSFDEFRRLPHLLRFAMTDGFPAVLGIGCPGLSRQRGVLLPGAGDSAGGGRVPGVRPGDVRRRGIRYRRISSRGRPTRGVARRRWSIGRSGCWRPTPTTAIAPSSTPAPGWNATWKLSTVLAARRSWPSAAWCRTCSTAPARSGVRRSGASGGCGTSSPARSTPSASAGSSPCTWRRPWGSTRLDSSGWRQRAARGLVVLKGRGERMAVKLGSWKGRAIEPAEWEELARCRCPSCRRRGVEGLKAVGVEGFAHRAVHNLWAVLEEAGADRPAPGAGRLPHLVVAAHRRQPHGRPRRIGAGEPAMSNSDEPPPALLLIGCSQRKAVGLRRGRAWDLYDGPLFQVLKKALRGREGWEAEVTVLDRLGQAWDSPGGSSDRDL